MSKKVKEIQIILGVVLLVGVMYNNIKKDKVSDIPTTQVTYKTTVDGKTMATAKSVDMKQLEQCKHVVSSELHSGDQDGYRPSAR